MRAWPQLIRAPGSDFVSFMHVAKNLHKPPVHLSRPHVDPFWIAVASTTKVASVARATAEIGTKSVGAER